MAGATFGRKGVAAGDMAAPQQRAAFGVAPRTPAEPVADDPYAAQRAAFLASERTRSTGADPVTGTASLAPRPVFVREKSMAVAYLLWFLLGQLSAHRFYLGQSSSAIAQVSLLFVGWLIVLSGSLAGALGVLAGAIWILADVFLIPGLVRRANAQTRQWALGDTFA